MAKLPVVSGADAVKAFQRAGWRVAPPARKPRCPAQSWLRREPLRAPASRIGPWPAAGADSCGRDERRGVRGAALRMVRGASVPLRSVRSGATAGSVDEAQRRAWSRSTSAGNCSQTHGRSSSQKHYGARRDSPVFAELHGIVVKTVGVADPIRRALTPKAESIAAAFVTAPWRKAPIGPRATSTSWSSRIPSRTRMCSRCAVRGGRDWQNRESDGDDARPVADEAEPWRLVCRARRRTTEGVPDRLRRCHRLSSRTWSARASSSASQQRRPRSGGGSGGPTSS